MPKMKTKPKDATVSAKRNIKRKFRIGNCKGGKSAHGMKDADLVAAYNHVDKTKYKTKIMAVLRSRGKADLLNSGTVVS